jgi:hypothetical protein
MPLARFKLRVFDAQLGGLCVNVAYDWAHSPKRLEQGVCVYSGRSPEDGRLIWSEIGSDAIRVGRPNLAITVFARWDIQCGKHIIFINQGEAI